MKFIIEVRHDSSVGIKGNSNFFDIDMKYLDENHKKEVIENLRCIGELLDNGAGYDLLQENKNNPMGFEVIK